MFTIQKDIKINNQRQYNILVKGKQIRCFTVPDDETNTRFIYNRARLVLMNDPATNHLVAKQWNS